MTKLYMQRRSGKDRWGGRGAENKSALGTSSGGKTCRGGWGKYVENKKGGRRRDWGTNRKCERAEKNTKEKKKGV